jgi:hypothetical protein
MTLEHTPGPWKLRLGTGVQYDYLIEVKGGALIAAYPHYSGATKKVTKANARLIAAAPELLAALNALLDDVGRTNSMLGAVQARAAIAKATGKTQ